MKYYRNIKYKFIVEFPDFIPDTGKWSEGKIILMPEKFSNWYVGKIISSTNTNNAWANVTGILELKRFYILSRQL